MRPRGQSGWLQLHAKCRPLSVQTLGAAISTFFCHRIVRGKCTTLNRMLRWLLLCQLSIRWVLCGRRYAPAAKPEHWGCVLLLVLCVLLVQVGHRPLAARGSCGLHVSYRACPAPLQRQVHTVSLSFLTVHTLQGVGASG